LSLQVNGVTSFHAIANLLQNVATSAWILENSTVLTPLVWGGGWRAFGGRVGFNTADPARSDYGFAGGDDLLPTALVCNGALKARQPESIRNAGRLHIYIQLQSKGSLYLAA